MQSEFSLLWLKLCIKIEPLQDQYVSLPACLCWLHEKLFVLSYGWT